MNATATRAPSASRERTTLLAIVLFGTGLPVVGPGALSFGGDEETTALAALALIEAEPPISGEAGGR